MCEGGELVERFTGYPGLAWPGASRDTHTVYTLGRVGRPIKR